MLAKFIPEPPQPWACISQGRRVMEKTALPPTERLNLNELPHRFSQRNLHLRAYEKEEK